jgi:outer membrane protein OmpA-like peptidoglycan-associated protein
MRRCGRCALVAGVTALLLGPLLLLFAKGGIDGSLRNEATAMLTAQGVSGVTTSSDWASLTLTGPASAKAAALAAVDRIDHRSAVDGVSYLVSDAGAGAVTPSVAPSAEVSPTAAPSSSTGVVAVPVNVHAAVSGTSGAHTIELTGTVQSDAQHKTLLDAATAAYGAGDVTDKITVSGGTSADPRSDAAIGQLAAVLTAFGPTVETGTADLAETTLNVTATSKDAAGAGTANAALDAAKGAGLTVTGTVQTPAAPSALTGPQVSAEFAKILAVRGITFDTGSGDLTPAGTATLDRVVAVLLKAPTVKIDVAGHTDGQGTASSNQTLSAQRAAAVKGYLVAHKISADRISTAAYGATRPIASNDTPAGRLANRRIDLTVVGS